MKILQIIGTLNPTFGGPVEALKQQTIALQNRGHIVEIVTLDQTNDPGVSDFSAIVHALGPSIGKYCFNSRLIPWLIKFGKEYDTVVVRGIWQFQSLGTHFASKVAGFPYYIFTHGALDPWFKKIYPLKHLKKSLYWPWAEYRVLRDARGVFFTTEEEKLLARQSFSMYSARELVVSYGIRRPQNIKEEIKKDYLNEFHIQPTQRTLLFLSRIHPKKGVDLLLEAFERISHIDANLHLVIAGPGEYEFVSELQRLADRLNIAKKITWTGMLSGSMKWGAFATTELFILPSHSENFGISVVEALACNIPVLITNKVNIWREINSFNAGIICDDTVDGVTEGLKNWLGLSNEEKKQLQINAGVCFSNNFDLDYTINNFVKALEPQSYEIN